jgi:RNA polymerase sigma factor (TIGR02999 family)
MGILIAGQKGLAMAPENWSPLMRDAEANVAGAKERLFVALYGSLHRLAERQLRVDSNSGISPTTLLHETYLDMSSSKAEFPDRARFMSYAARVMRSLIIDFARERRAQKRGAGFHITQLDTDRVDRLPAPEVDEVQLQRLSEALDQLALHDARLAELVDLKYFCGMTLAEVAAMRGVSERTAQRDWDKARLFLHREIEP